MNKCPYCKRPLAGEICPAHGFIGVKPATLGPVGPAGADGADGADSTVAGPTGETGATGATGATGPGYYSIPIQVLAYASPVDSATVYGGFNPNLSWGGQGTGYTYAAMAGTLKTCVMLSSTTVAGSAENWSLYVQKNFSTDELVETEASISQYRKWTNYAMEMAVAQGDTLELKLVNPAWATNPTGLVVRGYLVIEV